MGVNALMGETSPCTLMVIMEACTIGLTIMAGTAMAKGMSPFIFVVYTNALSSFLLLFNSFMFHKERIQSQLFTLPILLRIFSLGLIGITITQNLAFLGVSYSSPIMACGMGNLIPAFSFIHAIVLRATKIEWKNSNFLAKLIGTAISMLGAISLTLYRGPVVSKYSPSRQLRLGSRLLVFTSTNEKWVLGAILLAAASFSLSVWNIIQVGTIRRYPQVMTLVSLYSLVGTILSALFSIFVERNSSAWRLNLNLELLVIILTAIFGSLIRSNVHMWFRGMKGPYYVPMFKPLGIPIASTCGCVFFANTFHYGSMMSAFIIGLGYYIFMLGQIGEDDEKAKDGDNMRSSDDKVPLLQEDTHV